MHVRSIEHVAFEEAKRNNAAKETKRQGMGRSFSEKHMRSLSSCGAGGGGGGHLQFKWFCGCINIDIPVYFSSFPERLKVVCVETNKMHDVMSTALETDDRDYVIYQWMIYQLETVKEQKEANGPCSPAPKQILPEVQPAGPSGYNHSPEYFLTVSNSSKK